MCHPSMARALAEAQQLRELATLRLAPAGRDEELALRSDLGTLALGAEASAASP